MRVSEMTLTAANQKYFLVVNSSGIMPTPIFKSNLQPAIISTKKKADFSCKGSSIAVAIPQRQPCTSQLRFDFLSFHCKFVPK